MNYILNFLKGIVIGIANIIPGVSGGTLAVVLNIYDKLTESVGNFLTATKDKKIEYIKFLTPIILGAVAGIIIFSNIINWAYGNYPNLTTAIFLILIIPSIPFILKGEDLKNGKNIFFFILGVILTTVFVYFMPEEKTGTAVLHALTTSYAIKLFSCGVIAAGAMIIPGISGSMLLVVLGEYYNIIAYIKKLSNLQFDAFLPLFCFGIGVIIGLVIIAKLINYLLENYRGMTLFFIVGMIIVFLIKMAIPLFSII